MHLKLSRSQRSAGMISKSMVFCLDARLDLAAEEAANVRKYALGGKHIYNSAAAQAHIDKLSGALDSIDRGGGGLLRSYVHSAMAKLSLTVTIDSLVKGQHVECKDLDELLAAEEAIMQACHRTREYLEVAKTFDGREIVVDINAPVEAAA